jgi:hypothetical protein
MTLVREYSAGSWTNPLIHVYNYPVEKISFVAMNSAYGCSENGSRSDRGRLGFSSSIALSAFQSIPDGYNVVSLVHHTLDDFNEPTARTMRPMIATKSMIHCYGHIHQPLPTTLISPGGSCLLLQGGALYEYDGQYLGYSIVRVSDTGNHIMATYRSFYPDRYTFDVGTNVSKDGNFYNGDNSRQYWSKFIFPPSNASVCDWLLTTIGLIESEHNSTITDKRLSDTFVEPIFVKRAGTEATNYDSPLRVNFTVEEILKSREHFVIASDHEFGSTSILYFMQSQVHKSCAEMEVAQVPLYIDARRLREFPASITSTLRRALPDSTDPSLKLQTLHDGGRLLILIDDFDPGNTRHTTSISLISQVYPKARLVIAAKLSLYNADNVFPVVGIDNFQLLQIQPLNRAKVRALIKKWQLPSFHNTDIVLNEILTRFRALGIPLTPVYVVIYLSIIEEIKGFNPVNLSTVIEQFVESVLDKYKPTYAFRSVFDYRNQIDYLAAIAEQMCKNNIFVIEFADIYSWTQKYFDSIGIEHDYDRLIRHFIENKIFALEGNSVFFRYNIFLSFFIAYRMQREAAFKAWISSGDNFRKYINEIDLYCGLSRNDLEILEFISDEYAKNAAELANIVKPLAWNEPLENLKLPVVKGKDRDAYIDSLGKQLSRTDVSTAERDAEIGRTEKPYDVRPALKRAQVSGLLAAWLSCLRAYSVALKNLENIPKAKKEEHLGIVLEGWASVMRYACLAFRDVMETNEFQLGELKYRIVLPPEVTATVVRFMFLCIPVIISNVLRNDLGSHKLSMQLRSDEIPLSLSARFLQVGLTADMKLNEYLGQIGKFKSKAAESQFFQEALLLKMRDIYMRFGLKREEQKGFRKLAAELSADIKGLKGEERTNHLSSFAEDLDRNEQLTKLREASLQNR